MGVIVDGYCHADEMEAMDHFLSDRQSDTAVFYWPADGAGNVLAQEWYYGMGGVETAVFPFPADGSSFSFSFYACDEELEDGFMPWADYQGVVPPISPQLAGALVVEALVIFAAAWLWRNVRGVS